MNRWQFTKRYAARSNTTVFQLGRWGRVARECDCGEDGCEGWQMAHLCCESDLTDFAARFPVEITDEAGPVFYEVGASEPAARPFLEMLDEFAPGSREAGGM
ncbi:hypothetical protein LCGC14_1912650 [marine sediment metagenome]|uniref:Post-SET domain-containing protein n=1 Tax=marine sediment metagenome TaxID=412755 RepID=A0A0F9I759_9ZZZZ